jgi:hypothetical protein
MKRDWKPGDVAIDAGGTPGIITTDGDRASTEARWVEFANGNTARLSDQTIRPLVVIDPEDREQVERLLNLYWVERNPDDEADVQNYPEYVNDLQAALREIADPKPEEPTGLGAVVEDEDGDKWIRTCEPCDDCLNKPWQRGPVRRNWLIVPAVRILSEGVQS